MVLAIYGAGGFARELVGMAETCVFVSDDPAEIGRRILGTDVVDFKELKRLALVEKVETVVAVADAAARRRICALLDDAGLSQKPAVASSAVIGAGVELGKGSIICHHASLTASARIGHSFHANIYAYVAHDCTVGDFVTLAPRASVNGNTVIGDDAYIGTGAVLKQGTPDKPLMIGRRAVIGMGAVVTKDVPDDAVVVGNPARPLKS